MTLPIAPEAPVDATKTQAWHKLTTHYTTHMKNGFSLKNAFATDLQRVKKYSFEVGKLHFDLSKNLVDDTTRALLCDLAREIGLEARRDAMFGGAHINTTEDRAVLHTALRRPKDEVHTLMVDGQDCVADVHNELERMYQFAQKVRNHVWTGITGSPIKTVVSIGIGGSDLGPRMVYEALAPRYATDIKVRYISNIDPCDLDQTLANLDPTTTLFIVVSKTFTTLETMTNARMARTWFLDKLAAAGVLSGELCTNNGSFDYNNPQVRQAIAKHFCAVSTNLELVDEFGIDSTCAFGFWSWVGGRYSVDSAVGLSLILSLGPAAFDEFLAGFHVMDTYFSTTPLEDNVVALMGLLNVWYVNFYGAASHAVLPYAQNLRRFPAYLQQLTMESNGKSTRWDASPVVTKTGEIFWGEAGTNGQHAFYQLIHQGTQLIPCDFIAFVNTTSPLCEAGQDVHELFLANFLAQTKALAFGKDEGGVRAEGTPEWMVPARVFSGNRPSTSIFGTELSAYALGELISLYEHITFVEGCVWGVDSYDQWGVELGKQLAKEIVPAFHNRSAAASQDASTQELLAFYQAHRV